MKKLLFIIKQFGIVLFVGCVCLMLYYFLYGKEKSDFKTGANDHIFASEIISSSAKIIQSVNSEFGDIEGNFAKVVCERVRAIDFTIKEYPIDKEIYSEELDREYKRAFSQVLRNQIPIQYEYGEEAYFIEIWPESKRDYYEDIKEDLLFYYLDFDGDGLPELVVKSPGDVSFGGPRILKYNADNSKVYNFGEHWRFPKLELLCSGKLYCEDGTGAGGIRYEYQEIDSLGKIVIDVRLYHWYDLEKDSSKYEISIGGFERVEVDKESWDSVTKDFFEAKDNAVKGITYDELFSDM